MARALAGAKRDRRCARAFGHADGPVEPASGKLESKAPEVAEEVGLAIRHREAQLVAALHYRNPATLLGRLFQRGQRAAS